MKVDRPLVPGLPIKVSQVKVKLESNLNFNLDFKSKINLDFLIIFLLD